MKKQLVLVLAIATLSLNSCDEDAITPTWKKDGGAKPVAITSFYPESGASGTVVTIFGENFDASVSDSNVTFNGIKSNVMQVQAGRITVRVPLNLVQGDYQINFSARGQSVTSMMTFKVTGSEKVN